ncbi:MAG: hypothetical protein R3261_01315 [Alphaproteobacteria bacterium]|nr:hypothetical protein [Alphaproteobacteria bacterium]
MSKISPPPPEIRQLGPRAVLWLQDTLRRLASEEQISDLVSDAQLQAAINAAVAALEAATLTQAGLVQMSAFSEDLNLSQVAPGITTDVEKLAQDFNDLVANLNSFKQNLRDAGLLEPTPITQE